MSKEITTLVPAFGGNRSNSKLVGELLGDIPWVGIPFAGGMPEVLHIKARTLMIGDEHRHILNLGEVVRDNELREQLSERLSGLPFHPDVLQHFQQVARDWAEKGQANTPFLKPDLDAAEAYFVSQWMGRSGMAASKRELTVNLPVRWNANGGDSVRRYQSAIEALEKFGESLRRAQFFCGSVFLFLRRVIDSPNHALYCDPPWPGAGQEYLFAVEDETFHLDLRNHLTKYSQTRIVVRYGDCELIRDLYRPIDGWDVIEAGGRKQSNNEQAELYLVRNRPRTLFG